MPFRPPTDADLQRAVDAYLAASANHPLDAVFGSADCPRDITFAQIEQLSSRIGRQVSRRLTEQTLQRQSQQVAAEVACPQCGRSCRVTRHNRHLTTPDGDVTYGEPASHCESCRRDFFPERPNLRLDERQYSPELQRRLVETAAHTKSFELAAKMAQVWSGQAFSARHIGRLTEAIGAELAAQRDAEVDDWVHHRCQPEGPDPRHELVVVSVDGGRVQTREETTGRGPGVHEAHWREDKVARLQTMASQTFAVDPCPEPPRCFLDSAKLEKLVAAAAKTTNTAATPEPTRPETAAEPAPPPEPSAGPRWQPEPLVRTCVATMQPIDAFRWMVLAEAKRRHFFTALKRAFVGDGQACNWTLQERLFPDFVPILDFLHVASYLYAAAKALGRIAPTSTAATVVLLYRTWVRDCWQGRVGVVLEQLQTTLTTAGVGAGVLADDHPLRPVQAAATYLDNHQAKMNYPEYRRQGLPTTSSLIESQIKEFNYRVKGSEKFWNEGNAEAMLQVIARCLRDDGQDLAGYMASRPGHVFRRRSTQTPQADGSTTAA